MWRMARKATLSTEPWAGTGPGHQIRASCCSRPSERSWPTCSSRADPEVPLAPFLSSLPGARHCMHFMARMPSCGKRGERSQAGQGWLRAWAYSHRWEW